MTPIINPIAATSFSMVAYNSYTHEVGATPINYLPGVEDGDDKYLKELLAMD